MASNKITVTTATPVVVSADTMIVPPITIRVVPGGTITCKYRLHPDDSWTVMDIGSSGVVSSSAMTTMIAPVNAFQFTAASSNGTVYISSVQTLIAQ